MLANSSPDFSNVRQFLNRSNKNDSTKKLVYPEPFDCFPTLKSYEYDNEKGITLEKEKGSAILVEPICGKLTLITRRLKDLDSGAESLEVKWYENKQWQVLVCRRGDIVNHNRIVELSNFGFPVSSSNARVLAHYFASFLQQYADLIIEKSASRQGWHGEAFVLGQQSFSDNDEIIHFTSQDPAIADVVSGISTGGTYEDWIDAVRQVAPFKVVCFALHSSFVPPLLKLMDKKSFGIDFSGLTSIGKTTTLRLAASVWGQADESADGTLVHNWGNTDVALERLCGILSDLPVILDDTKRGQNDTFNDRVYLICSGRGKARGTITGLQNVPKWRTVFLSSGEASLTVYCQDGGARARVISISTPPFGTDDQIGLVNSINNSVTRHYGHAGPLWIQWLIKNKNRIHKFESRLQEILKTLNPSSPVENRLAEKFGLVILATELVHEALGIFDDVTIQSVRQESISMWTDLSKSIPNETHIHIRGATALYESAGRYRNNFFDRTRKINIKPSDGWYGRWDNQLGEWDRIFFIPSMFNSFCEKARLDYRAVKQGLIDTKMAKKESQRIDGLSTTVIAVNREVLMSGLD